MENKNIKPLTLREILILHDRIGKYLPETVIDEDTNVLEYSKSIIDSIIQDNNPEAFAFALGFMAKISIQDMISMDGAERLALFSNCIIINRIWMLDDFLRKTDYGATIRE